MNPFSGAAWFWRGWRGRSVTFAALFALGVFGVSALSSLRHVLKELGAPWYLWLLLPAVLATTLARKETEWIPDPEQRRRWAWGLVFGSLAVAALVAKFGPEKPAPPPAPRPVPGRAGRGLP